MIPAADASAPLASLRRRLASLVYELLLLAALLFVVSFALLPLVTPGHAGAAQSLAVPALPQRVAMGCVLFAVLALYFTWCWSQGRRTLPMKTWKLRLVDGAGRDLTRRQALLRYLCVWIGPLAAIGLYAVLAPRGWGAHAAWLVLLGWLWAFVDRDRQFLHDRLAGTRLIANR
ncbi:MAG: RDD family protein [Burkholderiales bacterium]